VITKISALSLAVAASFLAGCASRPIVAIPKPPAGSSAEFIVYRESSFIAGGVGLAVGTGKSAFAVLSNLEYVSIQLPAGAQDIFVQARTADPTRVALDLKAGSRVCLRTSSSPSAIAKAAMPIALITSGYHFYLDVVPCPSVEDLGKYKQVPVAYAAG